MNLNADCMEWNQNLGNHPSESQFGAVDISGNININTCDP